MTEKEYLLQARYLDERIHSKVQQVESLNDLATSCSAVISDMPRNPNRGGSKMADAVIKIVSLQEEINMDINALVELKREIMGVIKAVPNVEYQTLLVSDSSGKAIPVLSHMGADCRGYELFYAAHTPNA